MSDLIKRYQEAIRKDNIELQNELRLLISEERKKLLAQTKGIFEQQIKDRRILQRKEKQKRSKAITRELYKESYQLYKKIEAELLKVRQIKKELRESC